MDSDTQRCYQLAVGSLLQFTSTITTCCIYAPCTCWPCFIQCCSTDSTCPVPWSVPSNSTSIHSNTSSIGAPSGLTSHWRCRGWAGCSRPSGWNLSAVTAWSWSSKLDWQLLKMHYLPHATEGVGNCL